VCNVNLLKPNGYGMHQQVEYFNNCTLCPYCIYVFVWKHTATCAIYIKKLISFYNRDEKCLQYGTDWAFKWSGLHSVFWRLISQYIPYDRFET
jgi:hypothetical protein